MWHSRNLHADGSSRRMSSHRLPTIVVVRMGEVMTPAVIVLLPIILHCTVIGDGGVVIYTCNDNQYENCY